MASLCVVVLTNRREHSSVIPLEEGLAYWCILSSLPQNQLVCPPRQDIAGLCDVLVYAGLVVNSGWMMMKGTSRFPLGTWQRRWVVLKDDCIAYYYASCDVSDLL